MLIEFECPVCFAVLRVDERHASRAIDCPSCREPVRVPDGGDDAEAIVEWDSVVDQSTTPRICHVCGTRNLPEATECRNCGESFVDDTDETPPWATDEETDPFVPRFGVDDVFGDSWRVFRADFGPCVLGYVVSSMVWLGGVVVGMIPVGMVALALGAGPVPEMAAFVGVPLAGLVLLFVTTYSLVGLMNFYEHVVRNGKSDVTLLFSGSRFVVRLTLLYLLLTLIVGVGLAAFVIPGLVAYTVYWPAPLVLVEKDCGVFESLERGRKLSRGHRGTLFAISLASFVLWFAGAFVAGIFVIVTAPITVLLTTLTYLRLAGHARVERGELVIDSSDPVLAPS